MTVFISKMFHPDRLYFAVDNSLITSDARSINVAIL